MNIKLIVATHKPYRMPEDAVYFPVHAGAEGKESIGYTGDNTGDNISEKNRNYCELTALYWAWKNLEADYLGLVHYRRHFSSGAMSGDKYKRILTGSQLSGILDGCDVVVPTARNYVIETTYSQYVHAHNAADLDTTRLILSEKYPEYVSAFDSVMDSTSGHRFNMFIMRRDKFDSYCSWLFDILFELENRLDISGYDAYNSRVFGFVSERLLDVWLRANNIPFIEQPYVFMEKQNWITKGFSFLKRKFFRR